MPNSLLGFMLWSSLAALGTQGGFWSPVEPPRAQYQIECTFDATSRLLQGKETIIFRNTTLHAIERLALGWSLGPQKSVSAIANGKPAALLVPPGQVEVNGPLLLQLPEPLAPRAELELKIEFRNSYKDEFDTKHGLLLQGWYSQLWWGFGTQDDYVVRITVPQG